MKRKWLIGISGAIIIVIICGLLWFVSSKDTISDDTNTFDMTGSWYIYRYNNEKVENQLMIFHDTIMSYYKDIDDTSNVIRSEYTNSDYIIQCVDISKEFTIDLITNNNIRFTESNGEKYEMLRISDTNDSVPAVSATSLQGEYDVLYVAGEKREKETIIFEKDSFTDYKDDEEIFTTTFDFIKSHKMIANELRKVYGVFSKEEMVFFIDLEYGFVWELNKK